MLRSEESQRWRMASKKEYQAEDFLSGRSLLVVATATAALALLGFLLHHEVNPGFDESAQNYTFRNLNIVSKTKIGNALPIKTPQKHEATKIAQGTHGIYQEASKPKKHVYRRAISPEDFAQCNPAMSPSELSGTSPDAALAGFPGSTFEQRVGAVLCTEQHANDISARLNVAGFSFESVAPSPYVFPAYLEQVLLTLSEHATANNSNNSFPSEYNHLRLQTLLKSMQEKAPAGDQLDVLIKFFAWGLPVPTSDLEMALGPDAMAAASVCNLLAPCSKHSGMAVSQVMIFPMPNSSVYVVTDWPTKSKVGMKEDVVPIVNLEAMGLVFNAPPPSNKRVLDLETGNGVHGLMAAARGAQQTTIFTTSVRAMRFATFSVMMNGLQTRTEVLQAKSDGDLLTSLGLAMSAYNKDFTHIHEQKQLGEYDVLLAMPAFTPVPDERAAAREPRNGGIDGSKNLKEVFTVALNTLVDGGILALSADFPQPTPLKYLGCGGDAPGIGGSLVVGKKRLSLPAFAAAHENVASIEVQVANLRVHNMNAVISGYFFGVKGKEIGYDGMAGCGAVSLKSMHDPYTWPLGPPLGDDAWIAPESERACNVAKEFECQEISRGEQRTSLPGFTARA